MFFPLNFNFFLYLLNKYYPPRSLDIFPIFLSPQNPHGKITQNRNETKFMMLGTIELW